MKYLFTIGILCTIYCSCRKVENCASPEVGAFVFNATDTIRDDSATLHRYDKDIDFAHYTHTFNRRVQDMGLSARLGMEGLVSPSKYEWEIILHPSGKVCRVKDISFTTRRVATSSFDAICADTIQYTVNGIQQKFEPRPRGSAAEPAELPIRY